MTSQTGAGELVGRLREQAEFDGIPNALESQAAELLERQQQIIAALEARIGELEEILNTPLLEPFADAVVHEAKHQVYRWGAEHDTKKTAWDWFWTLGHLGSKAAHCALVGNLEKARHHAITAAALLANWHRHLSEPALTEKDSSNVR